MLFNRHTAVKHRNSNAVRIFICMLAYKHVFIKVYKKAIQLTEQRMLRMLEKSTVKYGGYYEREQLHITKA